MRIRYVRMRKDRGEGADSSLTIGNIYEVCMITFGWPFNNGIPMVTVIRDSDGIPIIVSLANFDVIDGRLPPGWIFEVSCDGTQALLPHEFSGNFWDAFHDGNIEAELIFKGVRENILLFHAGDGSEGVDGNSVMVF